MDRHYPFVYMYTVFLAPNDMEINLYNLQQVIYIVHAHVCGGGTYNY